MSFAKTAGEIRRDSAARALWCKVYQVLSADRHGLAGCLTGRAEAHVLRLSVLYAVLDRSSVVRCEHLTAALAVWEYAEESVRSLFGESTGNPLADEILGLLLNAPTGLSRTDIRDFAGKHLTGQRIGQALGALLAAGLARFEVRQTGGRPSEHWFAQPQGGCRG